MDLRAIACFIFSKLFSNLTQEQAKFKRRKPGALNSIPADNPTPAFSKKCPGIQTIQSGLTGQSYLIFNRSHMV